MIKLHDFIRNLHETIPSLRSNGVLLWQLDHFAQYKTNYMFASTPMSTLSNKIIVINNKKTSA
ncbi:hypothetical protein SAMN05518855_101762 [Paenibacillus sp. CF384]|nr:hypothetical protein SAMN05518855_101762 [Paenibacillus sp. CF384]